MIRSDLKYNWKDQIEKLMNETFKKLEALISPSNNQRKKEQYMNNIIDTFKKTLNNNANIKSRKESFKKQSKILKTTWIMQKNFMKQEVSKSEKD